MKVYLTYLLRQLALPTLVTTFALLGAVWLSQSLRFVDLIVNKGIPIATFLHLTSLLLPSLMLVVLPFALLGSVLFVYHRLTQESEITVMRAIGLSPFQIAQPCLILATLMMAISYSISLYFMPVAFTSFRDLELKIRQDLSYLLLQPEVFNSPTRGVTVYVHDQLPDGSLEGILVHDERRPELPVTMMAEEGFLVQSEQGPLFVMQRGNRQELSGQSGSGAKISILHFDRYTLDLGSASGTPDTRSPKAKEQFVQDLLDPPANLGEFRRLGRIAEGHKRLLWPFNTLVFAMIAVAALLSGGYQREGPWRRTLFAVVAATTVQAAFMAAGSLASRSLAMLPVLYAVSLIPALVALAMLLGLGSRRASKGSLAPSP
jgi:lipopolysaccharide export system permease protein